MQKQLTVLIVEDHWFTRSAVRDFLVKKGLLILEADSHEQVTALLRNCAQPPDVAVVDIVLPEKSGGVPDFEHHTGVQIVRELREHWPDVGIVFYSNYTDRVPQVTQLYTGGQHRIVYLGKTSKPRDLLNAVNTVATEMTGLEIKFARPPITKTPYDLAMETLTQEEREIVEDALQHLADLTNSERIVFEMVGTCRTQEQAAQGIGYSERTIESHKASIFGKLNLRESKSKLNLSSLLAKIYLIHRLRQIDTH